jgi:hypothetical protein
MRGVRVIFPIAIAAAIAISLLQIPSRSSAAQDVKLPKAIHIQAQAMGEQQQLGQSFAVNLIIEEFSDADDQKALVEAFNKKKNEGLVNALSKMKSKGRMGITGTLGYEVAYARQFPQPDGSTKIRLVTNRPIAFGEAWSDSRSMDYSLSGVEVILNADEKKNSGSLAPLCQLKLNKEGHLELELYQNMWKLVDVRKR